MLALWRPVVDVTVRNDSGLPVAGARVVGSFGPGGSGFNCTTGSDGYCALAGGILVLGTDETLFTVTGISVPGLVYDPGRNVVTTLRVTWH